MKTKEEILDHLKTEGYGDYAQAKILGYLIGAGIKEEPEKIILKKGMGEWTHFWSWLNEEEEEACNKCPLCEWLNELAAEMEKETDPAKVQKLHDRYSLLIDTFDID